MQHQLPRLPDPKQQSQLMQAHQQASLAREAKVARQRQDELNRSVRTHMEWCDIAVTLAMQSGATKCRFDIKPHLQTFEYYDAEGTLQAVMAAVRDREPYTVERVPGTLSLVVSWPGEGRVDADTTLADPLASHVGTNRPGVSQSYIDLLSTCNKLAEVERLKRRR